MLVEPLRCPDCRAAAALALEYLAAANTFDIDAFDADTFDTDAFAAEPDAAALALDYFAAADTFDIDVFAAASLAAFGIDEVAAAEFAVDAAVAAFAAAFAAAAPPGQGPLGFFGYPDVQRSLLPALHLSGWDKIKLESCFQDCVNLRCRRGAYLMC